MIAPTKRLRLSVDADPDTERTLRIAAASQNKTLLDFVTEAALLRARAVLREQGIPLPGSQPPLATPEQQRQAGADIVEANKTGWYEVDLETLDFSQARRVEHVYQAPANGATNQ